MFAHTNVYLRGTMKQSVHHRDVNDFPATRLTFDKCLPLSNSLSSSFSRNRFGDFFVLVIPSRLFLSSFSRDSSSYLLSRVAYNEASRLYMFVEQSEFCVEVRIHGTDWSCLRSVACRVEVDA